MKNRWNRKELSELADVDPVAVRVYSSQLLGAESDLVLHGGGNTSVKGVVDDVFGEKTDVLYVKGSGWDLRTIEAPGFPPTRLSYLQQLGQLSQLSDSEMMRQLRLALLDPSGPTPSVEAILHALIPHTYVDHSHADAVVTISNTPKGKEILTDLYGSEVLILPYIMPGFVLAKQVAEATAAVDWSQLKGIVLLHHGIFTFHDDAQTSYETMIELVSKAEDYLARHGAAQLAQADVTLSAADFDYLSRLRKFAGESFGGPILVRCDTSREAAGFARLENAVELAQRGPLTPDHTIHAKAFAAAFDVDPQQDLEAFRQLYQDYFQQHSSAEHQMLDTMPRYGVFKDRGMIYMAANQKRLGIVADISTHTLTAIQHGEALGGWTALPQQDLFAVEYWELEQAKLKSGNQRAEFEGKVALVSGAASGIGKACVESLITAGAVVVALDIKEMVFGHSSVLPINCDVTQADQIQAALAQALQEFGGIDLVVSNAGCFPSSSPIESLEDESWEQSVALNMSSHMKLLRASIPFLKNGFDPSVVIIGSKNVPAPGPGAAAYSVAKAGLNQLARVAALELGSFGIRVNSVHPNAIYDTAIWTDEVLTQRAAHYGMSVEDYRAANVLGAELNSADVAAVVTSLLSQAFSKTTGAQVAIDGGNERVI
ncbi:MAG: bifunctional aldolase/short-chain dehydrogenase [Pseudomonadales bacterium]|nr:bifunctional aldolase/short-chain dehydrogenase [Pseudomonadales bacterium]